MNTTQIKPVFNTVMGWAAFVLAILATLKLFSVGIPKNSLWLAWRLPSARCRRL
jgi:hypothetical protein